MESEEKIRGAIVKEPNEWDVLLGRGKNTFFQSGNVHFRSLVADRALEYERSGNGGRKTVLATEVLSLVHEKGGRFLRPVSAGNAEGEMVGAWEVVDGKVAMRKTKQALRDVVSSRKEERNVAALQGQQSLALPNWSQVQSTLPLSFGARTEQSQTGGTNSTLSAFLPHHLLEQQPLETRLQQLMESQQLLNSLRPLGNLDFQPDQVAPLQMDINTSSLLPQHHVLAQQQQQQQQMNLVGNPLFLNTNRLPDTPVVGNPTDQVQHFGRPAFQDSLTQKAQRKRSLTYGRPNEERKRRLTNPTTMNPLTRESYNSLRLPSLGYLPPSMSDRSLTQDLQSSASSDYRSTNPPNPSQTQASMLSPVLNAWPSAAAGYDTQLAFINEQILSSDVKLQHDETGMGTTHPVVARTADSSTSSEATVGKKGPPRSDESTETEISVPSDKEEEYIY